jgi:hypothetical protein
LARGGRSGPGAKHKNNDENKIAGKPTSAFSAGWPFPIRQIGVAHQTPTSSAAPMPIGAPRAADRTEGRARSPLSPGESRRCIQSAPTGPKHR